MNKAIAGLLGAVGVLMTAGPLLAMPAPSFDRVQPAPIALAEAPARAMVQDVQFYRHHHRHYRRHFHRRYHR